MAVQQFCLRWNNHQPNFVSVFTSLLNNESLVDVTLAAEGRHLQAHRVVLSACSTYFQTLFTVNPCQHPIVILKDVKYNDLKTMVDFMYYGEVNVSQEQLPAILKTAEMLKIKGLAEMPEYSSGGSLHMSKSLSVSSDKGELPTTAADNWSSTEMTRRSASPMSPAMRRKRLRKSSTGSGSGSTAERTSEELPSEITLIPSPAMVKPEPLPSMLDGNGRGSDSSHPGSLRNSTQEPSTDSEPREGSQDSVEDDHITMMGHSQDSNVGSMDTSLSDTGPGPSTSMGSQHQQNLASQASSSSLSSKAIKRGRPLIRQPRVKKELDPSQPSPESEPNSPQLLTVPPMRVERQHSEPTPNLLSVPQPAFLVKQLSHPLPSQSSCWPVHRQLSQPGPSPPTLNVQLVTTSEQPLSRVGSPSMMEQVPVLRIVPDQDHSKTSQLRVRTDEFRRASSSPQASSPREGFEPQRSVHCPVLRPGPALGCNFCWNTIDGHGRILRRKTKYHCPECQTNLCIVPCFQEYHERQTTSTGVRDSSGSLSPNIFKVLPKTSSI